jgi:exosortase B
MVGMYIPSFIDLARTTWATDEQGHGPIILAVSYWLLYQRRHAIAATPERPASAAGVLAIVLALTMYVVGRSQDIRIAEVGSQIPLIAGLLLMFRGWAALRLAAFPLFFLLFMVPLPGALVAAVTTPLKSAVSYVASGLLHAAGYPVGRSGVVLTVGQYQLLVADACAGLNSMFTLEALGLLYMNLMGYTSLLRNVLLAVLVIPIAFAANVVRVVVLVLVTFYMGDEAGQGFVHGFAGMVLFLVGLALMLTVDRIIGTFVPGRAAETAA